MSLKEKILVPLGIISIFTIFVCVAVFSGGYGDSYLDHQDEFKTKIENCINIGGTPQYTSTDRGRIRDYFGCVNP